MGVPGLWEAISKAGQSRSLAHLAVVDGYEGNKSGKRAYRIGIDASIWYHHATFAKSPDAGQDKSSRGANPELRLLFFRVASLSKLPLLPLFVFDGRERPKVKRGSKMGKAGSHNLTDGMKKLLDIFGMEWRMALGEAEAELAHLNRSGVIDAIMTDDVDTLVFGALVIIKNPSLKLSGNKSNPALNSDGKASKSHVMVYTAEAIRTHPEVRLTRGGLILIALLAGGDYDKGVERFGKDIGHALARCGFGDQLLTIYDRRTQEDTRPFLAHWRTTINQELHTNSRGFLRHKYHSLSLPADFPDMQVLENYVNPVCSGRVGRQGGGPMRGNGEINLPRIAGLCEEKFTEWGHRTAILGRFRTVLWEATVMRILRRAALEADEKEKEKRLNAGREDWSIIGPLRPSRAEAVGTPASLVKKCLNMSDEDRRRAAFANSGPNVPGHENDPNPLIVKIVSSRQHVSTDKLLEYRVEICPIQLVAITRSGIKGTHPEPANGAALLDDEFAELMDESQRKAKKKPPPDPNTVMRIWLPASIMRHVHPELVDDFEAAEQAKQNKKTTGKGKGKEKTREVDDSSDIELSSSPVETHPKARRPSTKKGQKNASASHMAQDLYQTGSSVIVLDPWFTADQHSSNPSCSLSGDALSAYFLCSQNPDPSSAPDSGDNIPSDDEDLPADEEKPRDRFDILFDQVMGISESSRPRKTNVQRKRPMGTSVDDVEGNRHEESSTPRPTRPIKKKKTIHTSVSDQASSTKQNRPRPHFREAVGTDLDFLELSDSEDLLSPFSTVSRKSSAKVSANPHSRSAKSVASSQVRSTSRHYYPEPSSSQDSRLVLDDADVIIDLT